jgi:NIPSNAP
MIIDHRTYTIVYGRMSEYLERYERVALPIQLRYLERLIGFFVSDIGPQNQVVHMWAYDSIADRQERRDRLAADPAWQAFLKTNAGTFVSTKNKILRPTKFSPVR